LRSTQYSSARCSLPPCRRDLGKAASSPGGPLDPAVHFEGQVDLTLVPPADAAKKYDFVRFPALRENDVASGRKRNSLETAERKLREEIALLKLAKEEIHNWRPE
jgi:hypothetical protein